MSRAITETKPSAPVVDGADFRRRTTVSAIKLLDEWVGPERAAEAKGRIVAAFQSSALAAKKPGEFYACTPASVGQCVAIAALTGIMPGTGAGALAYLIPQRPRKSEPPQLQYRLSHRGIAALARRAGLVLVAIPVGVSEVIEVADGEVVRHVADVDNPPLEWDELRGVTVVVKSLDGATLFRGWVARRLIERRRDSSRAYQFARKNAWAADSDPWHQWPVEMAMKTALHYAVSRAWVVIDDTEALRALSIDAGEARTFEAALVEPPRLEPPPDGVTRGTTARERAEARQEADAVVGPDGSGSATGGNIGARQLCPECDVPLIQMDTCRECGWKRTDS